MYPKTLKRRAEVEYTMHSDERKALGLQPATSLYALYKSTELAAGNKPRAAVVWACERAKEALETESDKTKARATHLAAQYNSGQIDVIEPEPDDDDEEESDVAKTVDKEAEKLSRLDA